MANNQKSKKAKFSLKQKLNSVWAWTKQNLKTIGAVVLVLGAGFGLGWWARSGEVSEAWATLSGLSAERDSIASERDGVKEELSYYTGGGGCYDNYSGVNGPCPEIKTLEAKKISDSELANGTYFVSVEMELENKGDKPVSVSAGDISLKDNNSFVYAQASDTKYDSYSGTEVAVYNSIKDIPVLTDLYSVNISPKDKVRGVLIFEVTRSADNFVLHYSSVKSEPFGL